MEADRATEFLKLFEEGTTLDTRIEDLNLDSLEFLELVQEISAKFGPVPDAKVARACTIRELLDAIPA